VLLVYKKFCQTKISLFGPKKEKRKKKKAILFLVFALKKSKSAFWAYLEI
jgi:hypothetical protein